MRTLRSIIENKGEMEYRAEKYENNVTSKMQSSYQNSEDEFGMNM